MWVLTVYDCHGTVIWIGCWAGDEAPGLYLVMCGGEYCDGLITSVTVLNGADASSSSDHMGMEVKSPGPVPVVTPAVVPAKPSCGTCGRAKRSEGKK